MHAYSLTHTELIGLLEIHAHRQIRSRLLELFLSFTLFCSHLRGIISLSNPFPYIKWCFLLRLASSIRCTSCWQRRCFPQKTPSRSRQGDGKERETDPSGTSWKISSFFVPPLKEDRLLFQLLFGVCHWTKQASSAGIPAFGAELFPATDQMGELCLGSRNFRWGL